MARLTNARKNHVTRWVIPAASQLLINGACKTAPTRHLSEVAHIEMGQSPSSEPSNSNGDGVPLIGGPADLGLVFPRPTRRTTVPTKLCEPGDIIVCVRATIGEPRWADDVYCLGRGVAGIRSIDRNLDNKFLFRIIEANEQDLKDKGTGTTFKTISKHHLASIQVPIITLKEQEAIGNFLEWLELNSEGRPNFSAAPPLPESLIVQRRTIIRIEELAAKIEEARGLRGEASQKSEKLHGVAISSLLNKQLDFKRMPIDALAEVRGGIQKGPHREPGKNPVRYLTVAHVHRNSISLSDPRFFEVSPEELERWRLKSGDVLIIEGNGSAEQIGRTAIFRGELQDCVHQNHVIRIRPNREVIDPEFLNIYLNSPAGQAEVQSRSRTTSGLRTLSVGRIKQISVPVLSPSKQKELIATSSEFQKKIAELKQLQIQTTIELDALLPSILDRAFKGEL